MHVFSQVPGMSVRMAGEKQSMTQADPADQPGLAVCTFINIEKHCGNREA